MKMEKLKLLEIGKKKNQEEELMHMIHLKVNMLEKQKIISMPKSNNGMKMVTKKL